jgi:hypothetical protein
MDNTLQGASYLYLLLCHIGNIKRVPASRLSFGCNSLLSEYKKYPSLFLVYDCALKKPPFEPNTKWFLVIYNDNDSVSAVVLQVVNTNKSINSIFVILFIISLFRRAPFFVFNASLLHATISPPN